MAEPVDQKDSFSRQGAWRRRMIGVVVAGPFLAMIVTAYCVSPRSLGFGTAGDLGFPDCSFLAETGYPCPTCGMTTSVSAMAHGRIAFAFRAHPFGVILFPGAVVLSAMGAFQAATGRNILGLLRFRWWYLVVIAGLLLAGWIWLRQTGVAEGKWPIR